MSLTVAHLKALLARPECRDDMPVVIESRGAGFTNYEAQAARIDIHDQLVITVEATAEVNPIPGGITPNIHWTNDCGGKKDYDGPILSVSTRYWPRGGSHLVVTVAPGQPTKFEGSESRPEIKPSAHSSIVIRHGDDECVVLTEKNFEAETEEAVKAQVESWVKWQYDHIVRTLSTTFSGYTGNCPPANL